MEIFTTLLIKLVPLYALVGMGFVAGRLLQVKKENISRIAIYLLLPLVVFHGVVTTKLDASALALPIFFFALASLICGFGYLVGKKIWPNTTGNLFAFAIGNANSGYFGIPLTLALFGEKALGLIVLGSLGFTLYENTVGFFTVARGHHTVNESLLKLVKLPAVYGLMLGLVVNLLHPTLSETYMNFALSIRGAYTVLGMMIIGLGMSDVRSLKFDWLFISLTFAGKFLLWPIAVALLLWIDSTSLHIFSADARNIATILSIVPLAANTVAFATELKTEPEKAAVAVVLSTLFALVYIPLFVAVFAL